MDFIVRLSGKKSGSVPTAEVVREGPTTWDNEPENSAQLAPLLQPFSIPALVYQFCLDERHERFLLFFMPPCDKPKLSTMGKVAAVAFGEYLEAEGHFVEYQYSL